MFVLSGTQLSFPSAQAQVVPEPAIPGNQESCRGTFTDATTLFVTEEEEWQTLGFTPVTVNNNTGRSIQVIAQLTSDIFVYDHRAFFELAYKIDDEVVQEQGPREFGVGGNLTTATTFAVLEIDEGRHLIEPVITLNKWTPGTESFASVDLYARCFTVEAQTR